MSTGKFVIRKGAKLKGTVNPGTGDNILTLNVASNDVTKITPIDTSTFVTTTLPSGYLLVGSASNIATARQITGTVLISNLGVTSITPGSITTIQISPTAGILYTQLSLTNSIVNADINTAANIAWSKLATGSINRVVVTNSSGVLTTAAAMTANLVVITDTNGLPTASTTTIANLASLDTATSLTTQLSNKLSFSHLISPTGGDLITYSGGVWTNLAIGTPGQYLAVNGGGTAAQWVTVPNGVPVGGTTAQFLAKNSSTNFDTGWFTLTVSLVTDLTVTAAAINSVGNYINSTGFTTGTAGQVLTVSGGLLPVWTTVAGTGTVTSINASGGTTGLTFSGGPVTSSGTLTLAGTLVAVNGGTGQSAVATGDLLYGSAVNTWSRLVAGTNGYILTLAAGVPTWTAPSAGGAVTSVTGTANQITSSPTTGAVVLSLPSAVAFPGTWTEGTLGYSDTGILWSAQSSIAGYNQVIIQNTNSGVSASANYLLSNDVGTATTFYGEFGINSSTFTGSGSFNLPSAVYLDAASADLVIGTLANKSIHFVVNSGTADALTISGTGGITVPAFSTGGVVHNSAAGLLSSSLIVAADVTTNTLTYAKLQQESTVTLLGNPTGGTANIQEITLGAGLAFSGSTLTVATNYGWLVGGNTLTGASVLGDISGTGFTINIQTKAATRLSIDGSGNFAFTQGAQASGWVSALTINPGANTAYTTATEFIDYDFKNRTVTWIDGTTTTQRFAYFRGNTVNKTTTSAIFTDISTVYIDPSVAGPGVTFTRNWALGLGGGILISPSATATIGCTGQTLQVGTISSATLQFITNNIARLVITPSGVFTYSGTVSGSTSVFQTFTQPSNVGGIQTGLLWTSGALTNQTTATEITDINFNLSAVMKMIDGTVATQRAFRIQGRTYTPQTTALTLTEASTLEVNPATAGAGTTITNNYAIKSTGNVLITGTSLQFKAGGTAQVGTFDGNSLQLTTNSLQRLVIDSNGLFTHTQSAQSATNTFQTFTQAVHTGGTPTGLLWTGGAHTSLTLSVESIDININLARIVQFATGALTTQRAFRIQAPTYAFVGASTLTNAYTFYVDGSPAQGTNATITNSFAAGFGGRVQITQTTTTSPIQIVGFTTDPSVPTEGEVSYNTTSHLLKFYNGTSWISSGTGWAITGATTITGNTNQTGAFTNTFNLNQIIVTQNVIAGATAQPGLVYNGGAHTTLTASTEYNDVYINLSRNIQFATGASSIQRGFFILGGLTYSFVGASTLTDAAAVGISNAPNAGTNATITNSHGLLISSGALGGTVTNSYGLTVNAQTGATNNYSAQFLGGIGIKFSQSSQSVTHTFVNFIQSAHTGGIVTGFVFNGGSHTTLTASSECINVSITSGSIQFSTGALSLQRTISIGRGIYSFVGASTITDATTIAISGGATAATNATITNSHALLIQSFSVATSGTVTNSYGLTVNAMTGATNNYSAQFLGGSVGILTSAPVSSLEVAGSYGVNTITLSANTTLDNTHSTVLVDATGAARTITLPAASGATKRIYRVLKKDSSANTVTISTTAGGNKVISTQYLGFVVQSDGTSWYVIGAF